MFWVVVVKNTDTQADRRRPTGALKGTALIRPAELCDSDSPNRREQRLWFGASVRAHSGTAVTSRKEETLFRLAEEDEDAVMKRFFTLS